MVADIRRKVFARLLLGWLILSLLIGGIVLYFKTEKIDKLVVNLALNESGILVPDDFLNIESGHRLNEKSERLIRSHFVIVEIYDKDRRRLQKALRPNMQAVEAAIDKKMHGFPLRDAIDYSKFIVGKRLYLQVVLPVKDATGNIAGYFEGIYKVDDETQATIIEDLLGTLLLVVIVVFTTTLVLYPIIISLNRELIRFSADLLRGNIELMEVLGSAVAQRDSDTNIHNYRVTIYAIRLAEALNLGGEQIQGLIKGAFLHDVGKIGISDNILLKPAKLAGKETDVMHTHVLLGLEIIGKSHWLERARDVVEFHHEWYDGSGYMRGLKGDNIPLNARIFAIVDVFDALTSKRPYKEAFGYEEAIAVMQRDSGTHFDPHLLNSFRKIAHPLYETLHYADDARIIALLKTLIEKYFF